MKRENQIGCRVSFPSSFFMELEDCWKYESGGCHRALTFPDFLNMLVGYGLESYKAKNLPRTEEALPEEAPDHEDADTWDFPHSNRPPLLRFQ
ncbi:hypothetical protein AGMMS49944_05320 [Spirochaetia bacterium]|nr:hypothetical protein AGMMS49944_05320 [Spirochaetia bacterium]